MQNLKYLPQRLFSSSDYAVLLLNREIQLEDAFFLKIWNNGKQKLMHLISTKVKTAEPYTTQPYFEKERQKRCYLIYPSSSS